MALPAKDLACPWFLANAFDFDSVDKAVPLASITKPVPSFNLTNVALLGATYPDQELVGAMAGRRVSSKERSKPANVMFGTNHQSSAASWRLVNKANSEYKAQGQIFGFPISVSPPITPAVYSPTGATSKKTRLGVIDPDNCRPTVDYSWPPPGYWMEWLTQSVNDGVQLQEDFPWVYFVTVRDIMDQALALRALGERVL